LIQTDTKGRQRVSNRQQSTPNFHSREDALAQQYSLLHGTLAISGDANFINGKSEVAFDNVAILSHSPPLDLIITTSDFGQWYDMGRAYI